MNNSLKRALEYIANTGGKPSINWFDDDHDPAGPLLRADLVAAELAVEEDGYIMAIAAHDKAIK